MQLQISNVVKQYGTHRALSGLHFTITSGGVFGLLGPNGAGKSTLMKILATLTAPTSGLCVLDGTNICQHPNHMRQVLGYLPQDVAVYPNLTAPEFLDYIAALKSIKANAARKQIDMLLDIFNLSAHKKRRLADFSGGMRQRVGISAALLGDPKVIIVDEPSVGLDPVERINLRNLLMELAKERIVILSTHIISDIETTATQLALIQEGSLLFCGTPAGFTQHTNGNMEAAYLGYVGREVQA